jgi:hypothetical protein
VLLSDLLKFEIRWESNELGNLGRNLAKVEAREFEPRFPLQFFEEPRQRLRFAIFLTAARWQSGHAAACKAAYSGSIPLLASTLQKIGPRRGRS